ncbi:MAG TPA: hypothetical protein VFS20_10660, partial [Longimicrobium sp.]|nr:hypothetical protein [Longimicrobium sp.]
MATPDLDFPECEAQTSAPIEEALEHFTNRFRQACFPSTLSTKAEEQLVSVFNRTVRHAMENEGFKWQLGEVCTEFALARVADIAVA